MNVYLVEISIKEFDDTVEIVGPFHDEHEAEDFAETLSMGTALNGSTSCHVISSERAAARDPEQVAVRFRRQSAIRSVS